MWRQPKKVPLGCSEPLNVGYCDKFFFLDFLHFFAVITPRNQYKTISKAVNTGSMVAAIKSIGEKNSVRKAASLFIVFL